MDIDKTFLFAALIFSLPLAIYISIKFGTWFGEHIGNFFWFPSDSSFIYQPDYSLAEAQVKRGDYPKAIEVYRSYAEQFPRETAPYLRIADIKLTQLKDPLGAVAELKSALGKTTGEDAVSLLYQRMADIFWNALDDQPAAMECLKEIQRRFPNSKHASAALMRENILLAGREPVMSGKVIVKK
ncbi:MAG: tetratricopeptide repeat protein [Verrucomicrobiae bacterium]|nr:tetratricopeptide repeat protein [Verrucomicrobiae bacterium]